jgi:hypothetical protein
MPTRCARPAKTRSSYRDLIVRVAGYSDYFCDLSEALQDEIIARTEQLHPGAHAPNEHQGAVLGAGAP